MQTKCAATDEELARLYVSGLTLQKIGDKFGITRERVRQRINRIGITRTDGGVHVRAAIRHSTKIAVLDRKHIEKFGCVYAKYRKILKSRATYRGVKPTAAFISQRNNARIRGIEWRLTLAEWWAVWVSSGKWAKRGRYGRDSYVMARKRDIGPYSVENVYITTVGGNVADYYKLYRNEHLKLVRRGQEARRAVAKV